MKWLLVPGGLIEHALPTGTLRALCGFRLRATAEPIHESRPCEKCATAVEWRIQQGRACEHCAALPAEHFHLDAKAYLCEGCAKAADERVVL